MSDVFAPTETELKTADLELRPATEVSAVFAESWRLWVALFPTLLLTVLVIEVPVSLIGTWVNTLDLEIQSSMRLQQVISSVSSYVELGAIGAILVGARRGRPVGAAQALVAGLVALVPLWLIGIPVGLAVVCGALFFIVPGIYVAVRLSLVVPAFVLDRSDGVWNALQVSWDQTKGRFGGTLLVIFLAALPPIGVLLIYLVAAVIWGVILELLVEAGIEGGALLTGVDYVVTLGFDLLAAYPFLFGWFPVLVYFEGLRQEQEDLWGEVGG